MPIDDFSDGRPLMFKEQRYVIRHWIFGSYLAIDIGTKNDGRCKPLLVSDPMDHRAAFHLVNLDGSSQGSIFDF
jgi:hypothetical protein